MFMKNRFFGLSLFFSWFQEKRRNNIPSAAAIDPKPSHCQSRDDMSTAALMLKVNNAKDPPLSRQVFCSFPLFLNAYCLDCFVPRNDAKRVIRAKPFHIQHS